MEERYITTVDLGSSKIALTVAKVTGGETEIIYYKETPSDGVRRSGVMNPKRAADALKAAVAAAEEELNIKILQVVVGLPGYGVKELTASAQFQRENTDSCIEQTEVDDLKDQALNDFPHLDKDVEDIYGAVPQSFTTDDSIGISEEEIVGMIGRELGGVFKVFVGSKRSVITVDTMLNMTGIAPTRKYFLPITTAEAVLSSTEKENGVAMVEIGGGITSLSIYTKGLLRHYSAIPFGGKSITTDIRYQYSLKEKLAENIKRAYGACMPERLQSLGEKIIQINDNEDGSIQQIPVRELAEVIDARMREIFEAILYRIEESGYAEKLRCGVVLVGGGANLLNIQALMNEMSGYAVRIGYPRCKRIAISGCPAISETSAAASFGMIIRASRDQHINCIVEKSEDEQLLSEEINGPVEEQTLEQIWDDDELKVKPEPRKKAKKTHLNTIWNVIKKVDSSIGDLYSDNQ